MLMLRTACIDSRTSSVSRSSSTPWIDRVPRSNAARTRPAAPVAHTAQSGCASAGTPDDDVDARDHGTSDERIEIGGGQERHVARNDDHVIGGVDEPLERGDDPTERAPRPEPGRRRRRRPGRRARRGHRRRTRPDHTRRRASVATIRAPIATPSTTTDALSRPIRELEPPLKHGPRQAHDRQRSGRPDGSSCSRKT